MSDHPGIALLTSKNGMVSMDPAEDLPRTHQGMYKKELPMKITAPANCNSLGPFSAPANSGEARDSGQKEVQTGNMTLLPC